MRKITLLLRNATKLDIEKIENYCKVNNIEVCCTDKSVYENGKLVSIEDDNTIPLYYFYIISNTKGFNELNILLEERLIPTGYADIGNLADSDDNFIDYLAECIDTMKLANKKQEKANSMFLKLISSTDNVNVLNALFNYSCYMNEHQERMLKDRISICSGHQDDVIQEFIVNSSSTNCNIKELRERTGMNRKQFCDYFGIPYRTVEDWENGKSNCAKYLYDALDMILRFERKFIK